jgi:hypothetical protein
MDRGLAEELQGCAEALQQVVDRLARTAEQAEDQPTPSPAHHADPSLPSAEPGAPAGGSAAAGQSITELARDVERAQRHLHTSQAQLNRVDTNQRAHWSHVEDLTAHVTHLRSELDVVLDQHRDDDPDHVAHLRAQRAELLAEIQRIDEQLRDNDRARINELEGRLRRAEAQLHDAHDALAEVATERRALEDTVNTFEAELAQAQRALDAARAAFDPADYSDTSVRELVLSALDDLQAPATSTILVGYIRVRYGRALETSRFGPLRRDEERAYTNAVTSNRDRPVWLVPGLRADGTADRRYLTRSDWDLGRRCTDTEPVPRAVYHLLSIADDLPADTADPLALSDLAADLSEPWTPSWGDDEPLARMAVLLHELAPLEGPDEFATGAIHPGHPYTPIPLRRLAEHGDRHQQLFGADHGLELSADPQKQPTTPGTTAEEAR